MSGKNNNKDSFESFFRKKAEEYDIPYREEDWLKLEKKLDLRAAQFTYRKRVAWITAASILVISLLGYFTLDNYNRINEITQQLSEEPVPETIPLPEIDDFLAGRETPPALQGESDDTAAEGDGTDVDLLNIPYTLLDDVSRGETIEETGRAPLLTVRSVSDLPINQLSLSCPSCVLTHQEPEERYETALQVTDQLVMLDPDDDQVSFLDGEGFTGASESDTGGQAFSRLSVGIAVSPDLSTVGSVSNFHDPGYKAGFTLEYKLHSNLSIAAGVMQSMVRYQARGGNYNPSVYWADGIVPTEIIGECLLIDIPISLKFDFMHFNHSRFFATAGLSSYIMQNEDYYFSYDSDSSDLAEGWSGETGTRHWMSNAGFSIGYELDVHSNWSLRAEPFIKVPLQEVGWGNVKLYSMGSFVSINYRL